MHIIYKLWSNEKGMICEDIKLKKIFPLLKNAENIRFETVAIIKKEGNEKEKCFLSNFFELKDINDYLENILHNSQVSYKVDYIDFKYEGYRKYLFVLSVKRKGFSQKPEYFADLSFNKKTTLLDRIFDFF